MARTDLSEALKENKQVAEDIKSAADDLAVVHAVLEKELPEEAMNDDAVQAVEQTQEIEKRLSKSAKKLDAVNRRLHRETAT